eukprot:COSAG05_NODE_23480_length_258_cov_0.257862_1_plen_25_part_01
MSVLCRSERERERDLDMRRPSLPRD